jgi:hypothetical protein
MLNLTFCLHTTYFRIETEYVLPSDIDDPTLRRLLEEPVRVR